MCHNNWGSQSLTNIIYRWSCQKRPRQLCAAFVRTSEDEVNDGSDDGHGPVELLVHLGVVDGPPQHQDGAHGGHGDAEHPHGQPPDEHWCALQTEDEKDP